MLGKEGLTLTHFMVCGINTREQVLAIIESEHTLSAL